MTHDHDVNLYLVHRTFAHVKLLAWCLICMWCFYLICHYCLVHLLIFCCFFLNGRFVPSKLLVLEKTEEQTWKILLFLQEERWDMAPYVLDHTWEKEWILQSFSEFNICCYIINISGFFYFLLFWGVGGSQKYKNLIPSYNSLSILP